MRLSHVGLCVPNLMDNHLLDNHLMDNHHTVHFLGDDFFGFDWALEISEKVHTFNVNRT